MSQCVNKIILVRFLGATPELKFTAQSKPVRSFNLAVNERWKDSEGVPQEAVQWFRIVSFGRLAEICAGEAVANLAHRCDGVKFLFSDV